RSSQDRISGVLGSRVPSLFARGGAAVFVLAPVAYRTLIAAPVAAAQDDYNLNHMPILFNRRQFLWTTAAAAQSTSEWGGPVLDIHLHPRRQEDGELDHINGSGVTRAVLLTGSAMADRAKAVVAKNPERFVWFVGADLTKPDALDVLRKNLAAGAVGLGELKSHVTCDGPEMRTVYSLAAEMRVPVLIHFADF